jgi:hypothetical protein
VAKAEGFLRREWWRDEEKSAIVGLGFVPKSLRCSCGGFFRK